MREIIAPPGHFEVTTGREGHLYGDFADAVLIYCLLLQASQTSGYRTRDRNERVGGHPLSWHQRAMAVDVVYDVAVPPLALRERLAANLGLVVIDEQKEKGHDHLQPAWTRKDGKS